MGRKLTREDERSSPADPDADRQGAHDRLQHRRQLLDEIAEQLGITATQLCGQPAPSGAVESARDGSRPSELVVSQQCADLIEAFIRIRDPEDRLRCLQFVRDTASAK